MPPSAAWTGLRSALKPAPAGAAGAAAEAAQPLDQQTETAQQTFIEAMDDDFNSSGGLAALFELVRAVNTARDAGATDAQLKPAQDTLQDADRRAGPAPGRKESLRRRCG